MTDLSSVAIAVTFAYFTRFEVVGGSMGRINYPGFALGLVVIWMSFLWGYRCYETRLLGVGTEEFRRVLVSTFALFGAIAIVSYSLRLELARGFIALALPLGVLLLILSRLMVRRSIQSKRQAGRLAHRMLIVGDYEAACDMAETLGRDPNAGFLPVGAAIEGGLRAREAEGLPVLGCTSEIAVTVRTYDIDTIAVTASPSIDSRFVRRLSWQIEGAGIDLVVAPALTDVAGPRIGVRPVAGLPLMYVDEPKFSGWTRLAKRSIDILGAGLGMVLLSPFLLSIGIAIRLSSPGPAVFKQERIGVGGRVFTIWKFRTMSVGADAELAETLAASGHEVRPLFKLVSDPRVTRLGRVLRRFSIDEMPQLVNVLRGDMSLVGPRPQRSEEVEHYGEDEHRRLMIRPGMTGLWQVSGRSTTSWEEAVRLDLFYVENWSLTLDLTILMRTGLVVLRGAGAH